MSQLDTTRGFRWHVLAEFQDLLLGPQGLRLREWLASGQARVLRQARHRTIYRVDVPGLSLYVKHYPLAGIRSWLRQLVRPSKARGECQKALEVARRGLATFVPLGVGERPTLLGPAESVLISRALEETEPLSSYLEITWPTLPLARRIRLGPRLGQGLGRFLGHMHDAGIWHHDLHAGNLLLRVGPDERPVFFLIDLHAVSLHPSLDWPSSRDNLIVFNRWLSQHLSGPDRLRCWEAYCQVRALGTPKLEAWCPECAGVNGEDSSAALARMREALARDLEKRSCASRVRFALRRDQRCRESNRAFRRLRQGGLVGHAVADLDPALVGVLLADPDAPFGWKQTRLLKESPSTTVAEIAVRSQEGSARFIYKRFRCRKWADSLASLFRAPPALRSWQAGHAFLDRSLATPRPLIVMHRARGGMFQEGYLLTEKVERPLDLHQCLAQLRSLPANERRRQLGVVIEQVARAVRGMHQWQMSHRDLKAANILVTARPVAASETTTDDDQPLMSVYFIDLVGVVRTRRLCRGQRVQNLARLNASFVHRSLLTRSDRLRFLRTYLHWGLLGKTGWKNWWRDIQQATQAKIERNLKSGRVLF